MKKVLFSLFSISLMISMFAGVYAQTELEFDAEAQAGVTPDSAMYGLENAMERIRLAMAFGSEAKAEVALRQAEEKLAEIKLMMDKGDEDAIEKARANHQRKLERANQAIERKSRSSSENDVEFFVRTENRLEAHNFRLAQIEENTDDDSNRERILEEEEKIIEVRNNLENKREELRTRLSNSGLTEEEIDNRIRIEDEDVTTTRMEAAERRIDAAVHCLEDSESISVSEQRAEKFNYMIGLSRLHLEASQKAFEAEYYGRAYGQANSAYRICKAAVRFGQGADERKTNDDFDRIQQQRENHERMKIEVECGDNKMTEVKVEFETNTIRKKAEFELEGCPSREEIIRMIAERTGLTEEELNLYISANGNVQTRTRFNFEMNDEFERKIREKEAEYRERIRQNIDGKEVEIETRIKDGEIEERIKVR